MKLLSSALIALLIGSGCAGVKVSRVTPENENETCGFRYYMSKPYLVVRPSATSSQQELEWEITYLPDYSQEYVVEPYQFISSNSTALTFGPGGTLTSTTSTPDSSAVAAALIEQLGSLAALRVNNVNDGAETTDGSQTPPLPTDYALPAGLYELVFVKGSLTGVKRVKLDYTGFDDEIQPRGTDIRFLTNEEGMVATVMVGLEDNGQLDWHDPEQQEDPSYFSEIIVFQNGRLMSQDEYSKIRMPRGLALSLETPVHANYEVHVVPIDKSGNVGRVDDDAVAQFPPSSERGQLTPTATIEFVYGSDNQITGAVVTLDPRRGGALDPGASIVNVVPETIPYQRQHAGRSILLTFQESVKAATIVVTPIGPRGAGAPSVARHPQGPAQPRPNVPAQPDPKTLGIKAIERHGKITAFRLEHETEKKLDEAKTKKSVKVIQDGKELTSMEFRVTTSQAGKKVVVDIDLSIPIGEDSNHKYEVSMDLVLEGGPALKAEYKPGN